jgi:hypothetical protein
MRPKEIGKLEREYRGALERIEGSGGLRDPFNGDFREICCHIGTQYQYKKEGSKA